MQSRRIVSSLRWRNRSSISSATWHLFRAWLLPHSNLFHWSKVLCYATQHGRCTDGCRVLSWLGSGSLGMNPVIRTSRLPISSMILWDGLYTLLYSRPTSRRNQATDDITSMRTTSPRTTTMFHLSVKNMQTAYSLMQTGLKNLQKILLLSLSSGSSCSRS